MHCYTTSYFCIDFAMLTLIFSRLRGSICKTVRNFSLEISFSRSNPWKSCGWIYQKPRPVSPENPAKSWWVSYNHWRPVLLIYPQSTPMVWPPKNARQRLLAGSSPDNALRPHRAHQYKRKKCADRLAFRGQPTCGPTRQMWTRFCPEAALSRDSRVGQRIEVLFSI